MMQKRALTVATLISISSMYKDKSLVSLHKSRCPLHRVGLSLGRNVKYGYAMHSRPIIDKCKPGVLCRNWQRRGQV